MTGLVRDEQGLVAIEFAIVAGLLVPLLLAVADIGQYLHRRLQVEGLAGQVARAVTTTCSGQLPAIARCARLRAVIADIRAASSLATTVDIAFDEAEFCIRGQRLDRAGPAGRGAICPGNGKGSSGVAAGDYVIVTARYTIKPLFLDDGVGGALPSTIVRTAMLRLQ